MLVISLPAGKHFQVLHLVISLVLKAIQKEKERERKRLAGKERRSGEMFVYARVCVYACVCVCMRV